MPSHKPATPLRLGYPALDLDTTPQLIVFSPHLDTKMTIQLTLIVKIAQECLETIRALEYKICVARKTGPEHKDYEMIIGAQGNYHPLHANESPIIVD